MSKVIPPGGKTTCRRNLYPAVEHLRWEFRRRHLKIGAITRQICFEILHSQGPVKLAGGEAST